MTQRRFVDGAKIKELEEALDDVYEYAMSARLGKPCDWRYVTKLLEPFISKTALVEGVR